MMNCLAGGFLGREKLGFLVLGLLLGTSLHGCASAQPGKGEEEQEDASPKEGGEGEGADPSKKEGAGSGKEDNSEESGSAGGEDSNGGSQGDSKGGGDEEPEQPKEEVPEEFAGKKNPLDADDEDTLKAGKALYTEHCEGCHAADGKGDLPFCPDFTNEKVAQWKDDFIFWKVTKGSGDMMPGSEGILKEEEIWQAITYLRTFSK